MEIKNVHFVCGDYRVGRFSVKGKEELLFRIKRYPSVVPENEVLSDGI